LPPIPGRHDDVALDALRPRRLGERQLAVGDAIGPVAEIFEWNAAKFAGQWIDHQSRRLTGLDAPNPCVFVAFELAQCRRDGPRRQLPELMTADA